METSDPLLRELAVPQVAMSPARIEARRRALVRELTSNTARHPRRSWQLAIPLASAGALAAALVVAGLPSGHSPGQASLASSWRAIPSALTAGESAEAGRSCQALLARQPWPLAVGNLSVVLAERRGAVTALMLNGHSQYGLCVAKGGASIFLGVVNPSAFPATAGLVLDGTPGSINGNTPFRLAYGQVAPGVSEVVLDVADGRQVQATVTHGRFFAWWPSGADATRVTATSPEGAVLGTVLPTPSASAPVPARSPGSP